MCNLYRLGTSRDEVAAYFKATGSWRREIENTPNYAEEVYPGYPGLVLLGGALQTMHWGFPLPQKSVKTGNPIKPKAVNNARTDKLATPFWKSSFEHRRCLIPVTAFAEADGQAGSMTRTWISRPDAPVFACAAIWRNSEEWGEVYSMVMTDPCDATACVHDRMPVMLREEDHQQWLDGSPADAFDLCVPWAREVTIERTDAPWVARR